MSDSPFRQERLRFRRRRWQSVRAAASQCVGMESFDTLTVALLRIRLILLLLLLLLLLLHFLLLHLLLFLSSS